MPRIAVYPGTFDPFTNGHKQITDRALKLFDEVIVAVSDHERKSPLLSVAERVSSVEDVYQNEPRLTVKPFNNLLADFAEAQGAKALIRGLRVTSDFEYEFKMAQFVGDLNPEVEIVYLMADAKNLHISSSSVKEIAALGGDVSGYLPSHINELLKKKYAE